MRRLIAAATVVLVISMSGFGAIPPAVAAPIICDIEQGDIGVALASVNLIVVSEGGNPDPRIPSSIIQIACTPEEYELLFPDLAAPTDETGVGAMQGALARHMVDHPGDVNDFVDKVVFTQEWIPVFEDTAEYVEVQGNYCIAVDCSRQEAPCEDVVCSENPCTHDCETMADAQPPPLPCNDVPTCANYLGLPCDSAPSCLDEVPEPPCDDIPSCADYLGLPCDSVPSCQGLVPPPPCDSFETCADYVGLPCNTIPDCLDQVPDPPCDDAESCAGYLGLPCYSVQTCEGILPGNPCEEPDACIGLVGTLACLLLGPDQCDLLQCVVEELRSLLNAQDMATDSNCPELCPINEECDDIDFSMASSSSYDVTVTIIFPDQSDPLSPKGKCKKSTTDKAVGYIESKFSKSIYVYCYDEVTPLESWKPSANGEVYDYNVLLNSCQTHVNDHYGWAVDDATERIMCWVREASNNGVAQGRFALAAEQPTDWYYPDHPDVGIALHELLHTHGAEHFPIPGDHWVNFTCGVQHRHWWGWHWHSFRSVMNYCWLRLGSEKIDHRAVDDVKDHMNW